MKRIIMAAGVVVMAANVLQAASWRHLTEDQGLPAREIQFIKMLGAEVWVGTLKGLTAFRKDKPETVLAGEPVWDVLTDADGYLWIGTEKGIIRQKGAASERSLQGESIGRIVAFGPHTVWALCKKSDQSRLMEYSDGKWRPVKRFEKEKPRELFVTRTGVVWVLLEANGMLAADPGQAPDQWKHHQMGVNMTAFCEDKQGQIWCGTWDRGIMVLEKGEWKRLLTEEDAVITAIRQDRKGQMWAATNAHGLWQYDGANWVNHLNEEGTINLLESTSDGRVFVSSQSECSLREWTGSGWNKVVDVPTMFIAVRVDAKGRIWAGNILDGVYVSP